MIAFLLHNPASFTTEQNPTRFFGAGPLSREVKGDLGGILGMASTMSMIFPVWIRESARLLLALELARHSSRFLVRFSFNTPLHFFFFTSPHRLLPRLNNVSLTSLTLTSSLVQSISASSVYPDYNYTPQLCPLTYPPRSQISQSLIKSKD